MFPQEGNRGNGVANGIIGGTVLLPTRFVWRYGGKRVFLAGSFTRWAEHILMIPVEGCPNVFQAICNLSPGYHQYKFLVDGEWRHDEHQPSAIIENNGTVNTVLLSAEPDVTLHLDTSSRGTSMDVDNATSLHMGSLRISEDEIAACRHQIVLFLSTKTSYDLLPESGKVIALDVNLPVKEAFHVLYEQGSSLAPLWDSSRGKFVGMLTALDFILILRELGNHGSIFTKEELGMHTISAWKQEKPRLKLNGHGRPPPRNLIYAGPNDMLKDVVLKILHSEVATVPIIRSFSEDGSCHQLLHLACLSEILKCICEHFQHSSSLLPIFQRPICAFPMGTYRRSISESNGQPLAMLSQHASLSTALSLLAQDRVSSILVVDDNNSLVDIYSRSDITALAKDRAYEQIHLDQMSICQALQLSQDVGSPSFSRQRFQMCVRSDPLLKVMDQLSKPGVRGVVIMEAGSKKVEGFISSRDVLKFFLV